MAACGLHVSSACAARGARAWAALGARAVCRRPRGLRAGGALAERRAGSRAGGVLVQVLRCHARARRWRAGGARAACGRHACGVMVVCNCAHSRTPRAACECARGHWAGGERAVRGRRCGTEIGDGQDGRPNSVPQAPLDLAKLIGKVQSQPGRLGTSKVGSAV